MYAKLPFSKLYAMDFLKYLCFLEWLENPRGCITKVFGIRFFEAFEFEKATVIVGFLTENKVPTKKIPMAYI